MKFDYRIILILILSCFTAQFAQAQIQNPILDDIEEDIANEIHEKLGQKYFVVAYSKRLSKDWEVEKGFFDPHDTLKDAFIFTAIAPPQENGKRPNSFVGIFKNGTILWFSEKEIAPTVNAELISTQDLNNNGQVEIITQWQVSMRGGNIGLWIHSWDGESGDRINALDEEGNSEIKIKNYSIQFVDIDLDGIKEIKGKNFEGEPVIYSWNGQNYGNWGISFPDNLPRNAVQANIQAEVIRAQENGKLLFDYLINNKEESLQSIEEFAVENYFVVSENKDTPSNWGFRTLSKRHLVGWQVELFLEQHPDALLQPGESDSSFSLITEGLPRPSKYYVQGNNGEISVGVEDLINNSVIGFTLGPYKPPTETSAIIDSLHSYTIRACELEWITQKGICNSLEKKLQNVKKNLQKGKEDTATNGLQAFINQVEAQRGKHLTSEGYGLLYFNGRYLLDQMNRTK